MSADRNKRYDEALNGPVRPNPVLSAVIFSKIHDNGTGATMNVHTHKFTGREPGDEGGYGVGGMTSERTGQRVPTGYTQRHANVKEILNEYQRVKSNFPTERDANLGSWVNPETHNTEFDASQVIRDLPTAMNLGRQRGEIAIYDFKNDKDINL